MADFLSGSLTLTTTPTVSGDALIGGILTSVQFVTSGDDNGILLGYSGINDGQLAISDGYLAPQPEEAPLPALTATGTMDLYSAPILPGLALSGTAAGQNTYDEVFGAMELPPWDATGEAYVAFPLAGDALTLAALDLTALGGNTSSLALPQLDLAGEGVRGTVAQGGLIELRLTLDAGAAYDDITLAGPTVEGAGLVGQAAAGGALTLLAPTVAGVIGADGNQIDVPRLGLTGTMVRGAIGTGSIRLPMPTLDGSIGFSAQILPYPTLAGTAQSGQVASGALLTLLPLTLTGGADIDRMVLAPVTGTGTQLTGQIAAGAASLPALTVAAGMGSASQPMPALGLTATATFGQLYSSANLTLDPLRLTSEAGLHDITLPVPTVAGTGLNGQVVAASSLTLPRLTMAGDINSAGQLLPSLGATGEMVVGSALRAGLLTLKAPTLAASSLSAQATLPALTLAGTGEVGRLVAGGALTLPLVTVDGGFDQPLNLPALDADGAMLSTRPFTSGALALPTVEVEAGVADQDLPALAATGAMVAGQALAATLTLPGPELIAAADTEPPTGSAAFELPLVQLVAAGLAGGGITGTLDTPRIALDAELAAGQIGSAAFAIPVIELAAGGYYAIAASTGELVLPLWRLAGVLEGPLDGPVDVTQAVVVNLKTGAISHYESFAFNSFGVLDGQPVGVRADGIYALTGDLDDEAVIEARVRLPDSDLGIASRKRIVQAYVAYRAAGPLELRLKTDDDQWFVYRLDETRPGGFYRNRVKVGRGLRSSHYQVEVANAEGADFALERLEIDAEALSRRS